MKASIMGIILACFSIAWGQDIASELGSETLSVAKAPVQHRSAIPRERDNIISFFVVWFMLSSIVISKHSVVYLVKIKISVWSDDTFLLHMI